MDHRLWQQRPCGSLTHRSGCRHGPCGAASERSGLLMDTRSGRLAADRNRGQTPVLWICRSVADHAGQRRGLRPVFVNLGWGWPGRQGGFFSEAASPRSCPHTRLAASLAGVVGPQEKYRAIRSDVQVATPVPKKSASSVQTGQPSVIAQANTGQSSASRMAIRCNACCCMPW